MGRPKRNLPLVDKIAQAFAAVEKLQRRGTNTTRGYKWTRATDVLAAVRADLLSRGVLIHMNEGKPEYERNVAQSAGGDSITECNLAVTYTFQDATAELKPMTVNGVGRDVEDKALYKAQTGAQKALLKRFGLMAEEDDDPEYEIPQNVHDAHDRAQEMRELEDRQTRQPKTVTIAQIHTFNTACQETGKSADEVSGYLLTAHQVSKLADLGRGGPFTQALAWAKQRPSSLSLAPKQDHASEATVPRTSVANEPYAVQGAGGSQRLELAPAGMQSRLPLPAPPSELKIGNQRIEIPARKDTYAL
jgi:ERF superfamily protein